MAFIQLRSKTYLAPNRPLSEEFILEWSDKVRRSKLPYSIANVDDWINRFKT